MKMLKNYASKSYNLRINDLTTITPQQEKNQQNKLPKLGRKNKTGEISKISNKYIIRRISETKGQFLEQTGKTESTLA